MLEERGIKLNLKVEKNPNKSSEVFYNSKMQMNRDISVSCLQVAQEQSEKDFVICEPLAGSGIRSLRYEKEVNGIEKLIVSDLNPQAVKNNKKNLKLNKSKKIDVFNKDANLILVENYKTFNFVDIDPFGSPIYYLDMAARSIKNGGFIGLTATDLAVLAGAYKETCKRRYHSKPLKTEYCHEIGVRIFIKAVIETLSKHDLAFEPLLGFYERHYYRLFGKVKESAKHANRSIKKFGYLSHCSKCNFRALGVEKIIKCPNCREKLSYAGPLWIDQTSDQRFVSKVASDLEKRGYEKAAKFTKMIEEESEIKVPFYESHELARISNKDCPKLEGLISKLQKQGYETSKTHFSPTAFKTNAPIDFILKQF